MTSPPVRWHKFSNVCYCYRMATKHIRIQTDGLAAFQRSMPTNLPDAVAANTAIKLAAELPERELHAMRYGMRWLLDLMRQGHLLGFDMSIEVEGGEIVIRAVEGGVAHLRPSTHVEVVRD